MQSSNPEFASGASAARNKLANALAEMGILVPCSGSTPKDEEFKIGVLAWRYGVKPVLGSTVVTFHWFQVTYEIAVPIVVVVGVLTGRIEAHPLFSASHDRGADHQFVLGLNDREEVVVFQHTGASTRELKAEISLPHS